MLSRRTVRGATASNGAVSYVTHGAGNTDTRSRLVGSTTTRYLTSSLGLSGEEVGSALRAFTRTPDGQALANRLGGGSRYYYATDHQNSVIGMFSATGTWVGGYSYSPYGEARATSTGSAASTNHLRYISGYWDDAADLYKLGARYYDAALGRFTQYDPSGQEAHPYSYAGCNPINASDADGLYTDLGKCALIAGALLLTVAGLVVGAFTGGVGFAIAVAAYGVATITIGLYPESTYC